MNLGKAIRLIRQKRGITQVQLSRLSEITQTTLSQIESGAVMPSGKSLEKISEALDVSQALLYIYGIEEEDVPIEKKSLFHALMPSFKAMANQVFDKDGDNLMA